MGNFSLEPIFSICVITYNRGVKALGVAEKLLPDLDDDWELLFLDNASDKEVESYGSISDMAQNDHRLSYIRHKTNRGFAGNFLACFELAKARHIMVMSDEDFANTSMIRGVLPLLHEHKTVGILRGSIAPCEGVKPINSHKRIDASLFQGEEAMMGFSFTNNYISGTIYNRVLLMDFGLIKRLEGGISKHAIYPHLYLDLLACAIADVVTTEQICCFEGSPQILEANNPVIYAVPYSFGSRVDQFIVLRDAVFEAVNLVSDDFDKALFSSVYLRLCKKYMYLITRVNSSMYLNNKIHPGLLHQAMLYICGAAISLYPELADIETYLYQELQKIHAENEPYL